MKTNDVLGTMAAIVEKKLVAYKDDFYKYDIERIEEEHPSEFAWMLRETGTHMMTPPEERTDLGKWLHYYEVFKRSNTWFYHVKMNADGSGEVTLSERRCDEFARRMSGRSAA